jgi:hypothetical protein
VIPRFDAESRQSFERSEMHGTSMRLVVSVEKYMSLELNYCIELSKVYI